MSILLLCLLGATQVYNLYISQTKNISIPPSYYHKIGFQASSDSTNTQIKPLGAINITKNYYDSSLFDVFVLYSEREIDCYMQVYRNSSWEQNCYFLFNQSENYLRVTEFRFEYNITSADSNITIIIDNTLFPLNGASYQDPLLLTITSEQFIEPNVSYYQWTVKFLVFIIFVCIFVCFSIWCVVLLIRYRREKKKISSLPTYRRQMDFDPGFKRVRGKKSKL